MNTKNRVTNSCPYDETPSELERAHWVIEIILDIIDDTSVNGLKTISMIGDKKIAVHLQELIFASEERITIPTEFFWKTPSSAPFPIAYMAIDPTEVKFVQHRLVLKTDEIKKIINAPASLTSGRYAVDD